MPFITRSMGAYTGDSCRECGRERVLRPCADGQRRCDKCGWNQDAGDFDRCPRTDLGSSECECSCGERNPNQDIEAD